jgi:hypothetical protein
MNAFPRIVLCYHYLTIVSYKIRQDYHLTRVFETFYSTEYLKRPMCLVIEQSNSTITVSKTLDRPTCSKNVKYETKKKWYEAGVTYPKLGKPTQFRNTAFGVTILSICLQISFNSFAEGSSKEFCISYFESTNLTLGHRNREITTTNLSQESRKPAHEFPNKKVPITRALCSPAATAQK